MLPLCQQALSFDMPETRRQATGGDAIDPYDVIMLAHPYRFVHFRMDELSAIIMGWPSARWATRWLRLHFSVQFCEQLHRYVFSAYTHFIPRQIITLNRNSRFLPTPSRVRFGSENLPSLHMGRFDGAFHGADVRAPRFPMGKQSLGFHRAGLLCDSFHFLLLWGEDKAALPVCLCGG